MTVYPRISARRDNEVDLKVTFSRGGVPTDPYAITKIDIYRGQVLPHNLVATILPIDPCNSLYPSPIERVTDTIPAGECGTAEQEGVALPGQYRYYWTIPSDLVVPDVYLDVWSFLPTNPCSLPDFATTCGTDGCYPDLLSSELSSLTLSVCNRFWVYSDDWDVSDGLTAIRLGFEPLDQKFRLPEVRPLEVGMTPLPLYDYDYNLVASKLPFVTASIKIYTSNNELLVDNEPMEIGIRQGSYRTNPFVLRYQLDTSKFFIGSYKYRVIVILPDGSTRVSGDFVFTVS